MPRRVVRIFRGPKGIRAGWSVAIFVVILAALLFGLSMVGKKVLHIDKMPTGELTPTFSLITEVLSIAAVLCATAIMGWIEGRSPWSYGLGARDWIRYYWIGWFAGLVCLTALIATLSVSGHLAFDGLNLHGAAILEYGSIWFLCFTLAGINEETLVRGYFQSTLARGMGFWGGAFVSSLIFSLAHLNNSGESIAGIACTFAAGMLLCLLLRKSGSLWLGIGVHAAWDWSQSYLYGTPDSTLLAQGHLLVSHPVGDARISGGAVGPEGSVLAMPAMCVGLLLLVWVCQRTGLFSRPVSGVQA
jgi:membrane protease YdiL (CAAX protease family)